MINHRNVISQGFTSGIKFNGEWCLVSLDTLDNFNNFEAYRTHLHDVSLSLSLLNLLTRGYSISKHESELLESIVSDVV